VVSHTKVKTQIESKKEEVAGGWRRLYTEELHNLYVLPSIIRVIKSRRMRWTGHVAPTGEIINAKKILVGKPKRKEATRKTRVDVKIILKRISKKQFETVWTGFIWHSIVSSGGIYKHGNKFWGYIK